MKPTAIFLLILVASASVCFGQTVYTGYFYSPGAQGMRTDDWLNFKPNSGATSSNNWNVYHLDGNSSLFQVNFGSVTPSVYVGQGRTTDLFVNGKIGIGTTSPLYGRLQVTQSSDGPDHGFGILNSTGSRAMRIWVDANNSYIYSNGVGTSPLTLNNGGNVGIGTPSPASALSVKGRVGIRADANPTAPTETMRLEGAITAEENVLNVTNLADQDFIVRLSGAGAASKRTIIGPSTQTRFSLGVGVSSGNEYLTIQPGGNVGIGTTSPTVKLSVFTGSSNTNYSALTSSDLGLFLKNTNATNNNFNLVSFGDAGGYGVAHIGAIFKDHTNHYGQLIFATKGAGVVTQRMIIDEVGNVGIGTSSPNEKLTVNGTIYSKEVKVDLNVPGPDYVFEKDYNLPSLEEIKAYIDQHKHLPEVPSAKEMETNGINLGDMNMILLKKVEELTLLMIEQQKEIAELRSEISEVRKK